LRAAPEDCPLEVAEPRRLVAAEARELTALEEPLVAVLLTPHPVSISRRAADAAIAKIFFIVLVI